MGIFILILALYIVYILLCRQLNLWAVKNDKDSGFIENRPYMWFVPIFGLLLIGIYAVYVVYEKWSTTESAKWFFGEN